MRIVHETESIVYERELERHREIRWPGLPRAVPPGVAGVMPADPPRFDPTWLARAGQVVVRPLDAYAALASEVLS